MFAEIIPLKKTKKNEIFIYKIPPSLTSKIKRGSIVEIPFGEKNTIGVVINIKKNILKKDFEIKEINKIASSIILKKWQIETAFWLSEKYLTSKGKSLALFLPPIFKNEEKIKININWKKPQKNIKVKLTNSQRNAIEKINNPNTTLFSKQKFLLYTPFIEEKWPIYLQLIKHAIEENKQILIIFPEKSHLKKAEKYLKNRKISFISFWGQFSKKKKLEILKLVEKKSPLVVLGLKSALFLPFSKLKTIIIDEEENESHKEEREPQYYTAQLALKLGEIINATVILQTNQPSIESYWKTIQGQLILIKVTRKINYKTPLIKILDLRKEKNLKSKFLNNKLKKIIQNALKNNKKIIFYLDRKGYSYLKCDHCNYVFECQNCNKNLIFEKETLYCYLCQKKYPIPHICPNCKSFFISEISIGIEKIIKEIKENFPKVKFARIDSSVIKNEKELLNIQQEIEKNQPQILITTRLIFSFEKIKKFDLLIFPLPESNFAIPDFKIEEKTLSRMKEAIFTLIKRKEGNILIATYVPHHPLFQTLLDPNNFSFYKFILNQRKKLFLPPFSAFIKISYQPKITKNAFQKIESIKRKIEKKLHENNEYFISGPFVHFSGKIKRPKSFSLILKLPEKNLEKINEILKNLNRPWKKEIEF